MRQIHVRTVTPTRRGLPALVLLLAALPALAQEAPPALEGQAPAGAVPVAVEAPPVEAPVPVVAFEVIGVVEDSSLDEPLPGARVRVGEVTAITGPDGRFALSVPTGAWDVEVVGPDGVAIPGPALVVDRTVGVLLSWAPGLARLPLQLEGAPRPVAEGVLADPATHGLLAGVVRDDVDDLPIAGARVLLGDVEVATDADGRFTVPLPAGGQEVIVVMPGFGSRTIGSVNLVPGQETAVRVGLVPTGTVSEPEVVDVRAPKLDQGTLDLLEERKEATAVTDFVGTEQMQRTGDSNAALALRRVTGVTIVGGRYVYVRGLGDRYAMTLLNGSTLPSPEPEKRTVPLDLFPAAVLDAVVLQKTPSADRPAEFAGGIVQIRTKTVPDHLEATVTAQVGARSNATFTRQLLGPRGPTDFLGVDGGWRKLPDLIATEAGDQPIRPKGLFTDGGFDPEQIAAFGRAVPNRWDLSSRMLLPDMTLRAYLGTSAAVPNGPRLGFRTGFSFTNAWTVERAYQDTFGTDGTNLILQKHATYVRPTNRINLGGILALGASWGDEQVVESNTLLNRVSEYTVTDLYGTDPNGPSGDDHRTQASFVEQQLLFEQLRGHHLLSRDHGITLDWRYAFSRATRLEPDRRQTAYGRSGDTYTLSQATNWNEVAWLALRDDNHDAAFDLAIPVLADRGTHPGEVKLGAMTMQKARTSGARRFSYGLHGTQGIDTSASVGSIIVPENIGNDGSGKAWLSLDEETTTSDDYTARQQYYAGYAMADLPVVSRLRLMAGARVEGSDQVASTFQLFNPAQVPVDARLKTVDVLPSALVTIGLGRKASPDEMLLRLAYGRTVSRPEFRELSQVPYTDFKTNTLYFGNPALKRALIDNVDLRWEWYPRVGDSVSVAGFYKRFTDPIEAVASPAAVSNLASTFANAPSATNIGGEVEFRTNLDWMHPRLLDVYVAGNASYIFSRVEVPEGGNDTSRSRPLQGQSPWVVNAQLGYDNPEAGGGVNAALIYNVFGPRILNVGQAGIPDTYELPVHRLDFMGTFGIAAGWQVQLRATNLLDASVRQRTGDKVSQAYKEGVGVYLGVQWNLPRKEAPKT